MSWKLVVGCNEVLFMHCHLTTTHDLFKVCSFVLWAAAVITAGYVNIIKSRACNSAKEKTLISWQYSVPQKLFCILINGFNISITLTNYVDKTKYSEKPCGKMKQIFKVNIFFRRVILHQDKSYLIYLLKD